MTSAEWLQIGGSLLAVLGGPPTLWGIVRFVWRVSSIPERVSKVAEHVEDLNERIDQESRERRQRDEQLLGVINDALVQQARLGGRVDAGDLQRKWLEERTHRHSQKLRHIPTPTAPRPSPTPFPPLPQQPGQYHHVRVKKTK